KTDQTLLNQLNGHFVSPFCVLLLDRFATKIAAFNHQMQAW
ncbi:hypothetical protein D030_2039B, partial [Vibrio parahaemolyticus AQ3810]